MPTTDANAKDELAANLAANLSRILDQRSWTRLELAKAIGVGEVSIYRILAKTHLPNLVTVVRIAETLGVTVDDLITENSSVGA